MKLGDVTPGSIINTENTENAFVFRHISTKVTRIVCLTNGYIDLPNDVKATVIWEPTITLSEAFVGRAYMTVPGYKVTIAYFCCKKIAIYENYNITDDQKLQLKGIS